MTGEAIDLDGSPPGTPRLEFASPSASGKEVAAGQKAQIDAHRGQADSAKDVSRISLASEGFLILSVSGQTVESITQLLRQARLQSPGLRLIVLAPDNSPVVLGGGLQVGGAQVLSWPRDVAKLSEVIASQERPGPGTGPFLPRPQDLRAAILMLALTPSQLPLAEQLVVAARHPVSILLTGEAGTGKSRVARFIHDLSGAPPDRFFVLSGPAIAQKLLEEPLGQVARLFCGTAGAEPEASGGGHGTLVLDEIDALDLEQQAGLLGVLETNGQAKIGNAFEPRMIATSKRNLKKEMECGRFRTDLYFHLSVLAFHFPPLRERTGDILPLARDIIARYSHQFGKELCELSPQALEALEAYSWPGNIRELENVLQQAVLLNAEPVLLPRHLPKAIQGRRPDLAEATERSTIYRVLGKHGYNYTRAAQELGISRVWLYKKLKKYGILRKPRILTLDR